jgi:hypothetical protein
MNRKWKKTAFRKWAPWKETPITLKIAKTDDIELYHSQEIKNILRNKGIIGYSEGSKLGNQHTVSGLYILNGLKGISEIRTESYSWYLGLNQEILDAELLAIFKALSEALKIIRNSPNNPNKDTKIYIYTDSQAAIQRLEKIADLGPG